MDCSCRKQIREILKNHRITCCTPEFNRQVEDTMVIIQNAIKSCQNTEDVYDPMDTIPSKEVLSQVVSEFVSEIKIYTEEEVKMETIEEVKIEPMEEIQEVKIEFIEDDETDIPEEELKLQEEEERRLQEELQKIELQKLTKRKKKVAK